MKEKIPTSALNNILQGFDLGTVREIKPLVTSGNIAYTVETGDKTYVFRLSPSGARWRSKQEIDAELEIMDYLSKKKFPVSMSIIANNGNRIISWNKHFGYLREFIEAKPKLDPTIKEVKKFGELLGRFHNLVENYKTKNKRKHIWDLKETKKNFKQNKKIILKSNFAQKKDFIKIFEKEISQLNFPKDLPSGTIHEDLGKRHILWRGNEIVGVIDFDRSYYGRLILDFGQACRGWCFTDNWKKWSNKNFKALLDGYQSKRKLTDLEKKYLTDSIRFGILERSLSFCLRFICVSKDVKDGEYAAYSVSENGPLGMVEKNRTEIEKLLK